MLIDFSDVAASQRYHIMTQTLIPRPIAWVLTDSGEHGKPNYNLAPFSYFTAVSSEPALMMISIGQKADGSAKDTLKNIIEKQQMVIHIPRQEQAQLVTETAASLAFGESELSNTQLTTSSFSHFPLPRINECDIAYACELFEIKEIKGAAQKLVFAQVKELYINDAVVNEQGQRLHIDANKIDPLARLGGGEYAGITAPFTFKRPK